MTGINDTLLRVNYLVELQCYRSEELQYMIQQ
jgi:hypothetical protein